MTPIAGLEGCSVGLLPAILVLPPPSSCLNREIWLQGDCEVSPPIGSEVQERPNQAVRYDEEKKATQKGNQIASHASLQTACIVGTEDSLMLSVFLSVPGEQLLGHRRIELKHQSEARRPPSHLPQTLPPCGQH